MINVGYYLHFVDEAKNRLEHTDYRALMPIPEREVHTLDHEISSETYELGVNTIEEFQRINLLPKAEKEAAIAELEEGSPMKELFFSSIYGESCLSFANELHHILNGEIIDHRSSVRRMLVPRERTWLLRNTEGFINKHTFLIKRLLTVWYYLKRLHLPFWVNGNPSN